MKPFPRLLPPPTPSEKKLIRRAALLLGKFTLVTFICGWAAMVVAQKRQAAIVPKIVGMEQAQADKALASKGLRLKVVRSQFDERVPAGLISRQKPRANEYLKRGETVEADISKGSPKVKIPSVVHSSLQEAQIQLAGSRLRVGRESFMDSADPKDTVLAQTPPADQLVDSFTEVNLLVSAGMPDPAYTMPSLKNQPLEKAFKMLRPAGITLEKIQTEIHDDLASETILSQKPPAGAKIQKRDKVSLVVSAKSTDANLRGRLAKVVFDMPEGNPRRLQIDVYDGSGTRTIYNKMESPKDRVEVEVNVTGRASAQVYLNQEFVKEIPID